jgi:hypothetical protein
MLLAASPFGVRPRFRSEWREEKGFLEWFFVPEGHMTVARRFIAGSEST